nr:transposase [Pyrinomonadaceae bacterium]
WNIVAWFKRLCLPQHCHTQTVKTLRHRVLKVAGKIVHQSRQLFLVLSEEYRFRDLWSFAFNKLGRLVLHSP